MLRNLDLKFPISYHKFVEVYIQSQIFSCGVKMYIEPDNVNIIEYLDSRHLYIGIYTTGDGEQWLVDVCGVRVETCSSRKEAEEQGILFAFKILEDNE